MLSAKTRPRILFCQRVGLRAILKFEQRIVRLSWSFWFVMTLQCRRVSIFQTRVEKDVYTFFLACNKLFSFKLVGSFRWITLKMMNSSTNRSHRPAWIISEQSGISQEKIFSALKCHYFHFILAQHRKKKKYNNVHSFELYDKKSDEPLSWSWWQAEETRVEEDIPRGDIEQKL